MARQQSTVKYLILGIREDIGVSFVVNASTLRTTYDSYPVERLDNGDYRVITRRNPYKEVIEHLLGEFDSASIGSDEFLDEANIVCKKNWEWKAKNGVL